MKLRILLIAGFALLVACSNSSSSTTANASAGPDSQSLLAASQDDADWPIPGKTYEGNRYTGLTQIDKSNVATLRKAWTSEIVDNGEQESSPVAWQGKLYIVTPHDNVLAFNGINGKLLWQFPYEPAYVLLFAVNRGAGLADGKVFLGTQDCHVIALDANTGKRVWNVVGCRDNTNSWYSMAAYPYKGSVLLATAGGDNGNRGLLSAFSTTTGQRKWDWETIDRSTWPGTSWQHGGAAIWSGMAIDPTTNTAFVAPGNPGPDMVVTGRKGPDLYSNSIVALDISGTVPRVKWYYQIFPNDSHDTDPAMIPVVFDATVHGATRHLVAVGDKAADFVVLDRTNGHVVYRMAVDRQFDTTVPPTLAGVRVCPNHGGGIEWNGGAYDPATNYFIVPSTVECGVFKILDTHPQYIPGQPYEGGALPKRTDSKGLVTAINLANGNVAWQKPLDYGGQGGAMVTKTGIVFTSDLRGRIYALDTKTGKELWHDDTGAAIVAPLTAYSAGGTQYITTLIGQAGNQQVPNIPMESPKSFIVAYSVQAQQVIENGPQGQKAVANAPANKSESSAGAQTGAVPYTAAQVAAGKAVYTAQCSACHGAKLQGVSGPALTGAGFGHSRLTVSALRSVVTKQMPLTAPGSLKPDEYAAVMAYLVAWSCVKPTGGGTTPFPTADTPANKTVTLEGDVCPVK